jgi:hypothetical protein
MKMNEDIVKRLRSWVLPTLYDDTLDVINEAAYEIERLKGYIEELEGTISISALANEQLKKENKRLMIYRKAIHKMCSHRMRAVDDYIMDAKQAVAWYEDLNQEALDKMLEVDLLVEVEDYIRIAKQAHLDAGD